MVQFKPVVKTGEIKVMLGAIEAGRISKGAQGKVYSQSGKADLTTGDLIRVLRQLGVTVAAGTEDKIEAAVLEQATVAAQARAIRLGKRTGSKTVKAAAVKATKAVKAKPLSRGKARAKA